jgi:hypothetical protein
MDSEANRVCADNLRPIDIILVIWQIKSIQAAHPASLRLGRSEYVYAQLDFRTTVVRWSVVL